MTEIPFILNLIPLRSKREDKRFWTEHWLALTNRAANAAVLTDQ